MLFAACAGGDDGDATAQSGTDTGTATTASSASSAEAEDPICDSGDAAQRDDPCIISTAEQLQELSNKARRYYALGGDIDASGTADWNDGTGFVPIRHFRGALDGRGHTITDLYVNPGSDVDRNWVGMFANTNKGSEVRDLGLENATVTVEEGESVGSLIGNLQGRATNVWADADVQGEDTVGGLVGSIAGDGELENAYSLGTITARRKGGGLIGSNYGTVTTTFSAAAVGVEVSDAGGIAASNLGTVEDSYWDVEATGIPEASNGEGHTTEQLQQEETFAGWDFADTWTIREGEDYPDLQSASRD